MAEDSQQLLMLAMGACHPGGDGTVPPWIEIHRRKGFSMCRYQNGTKTDQLYDVAGDLQQPVTLAMGACGEVTVNFFHAHLQGVDWVFVDHPSFHRPGE